MGLLPVVPMTIVSALLMIVVSKLTPFALPARATVARYFDLLEPPAVTSTSA
jgi:hypothetical protein